VVRLQGIGICSDEWRELQYLQNAELLGFQALPYRRACGIRAGCFWQLNSNLHSSFQDQLGGMASSVGPSLYIISYLEYQYAKN
jgi:hypothetical protein